MRSLVICGLVGSSLAGLVFACSDDATSGNGGTSSSSSSSSTSSSSGGTDIPDASAAKGGGAISLGSGTGYGSFSAAFSRGQTGDGLPNCVKTTIGPCDIRECPEGAMSTDAGPVEIVSAGPITVTGGVIPAPGITVQPPENKVYLYSGTGALWAGGETFTVNVAGAVVPGFTQTAQAPAPINITTPTLPAPSGINVRRDSDYVFTWTTGSSEVGEVLITMGGTPGAVNTVGYCKFPVSAKTAAIPVAALAKIQGPSGALQIAVSSSSIVLQGEYLVIMTLTGFARASGNDFTGYQMINYQ